MAVDDESLQTVYFNNALIEFLYFIIIYLESYGFILIATLTKHIKFFKSEVGELLLSLSGDSTEQKLHQFLITMNCFEITENKVQVNEMTIHVKNSIFEHLLLSKTVDLVLKGCTNVNDICKNLNLSNVIVINQKKLLKMLKKTTHFSVQRNRFLSLNHFHGIFGYESYFCNHVINYFQNILHHARKMSLDDIQCHAKCFSSCGTNHILSILCILYCSKSFHFKDGNIMLSKKIKKHRKQKPLDLNLVSENFSLTTIPIRQIVFSAYGPNLQNWTGEICKLRDNCGSIYCITDFTNGSHGVFTIYFNQFALKMISEVPDLKKYLQIRDVVQFDASYHYSEEFDYWKATKVKIVNSVTSDYDEQLFSELKNNSEAQRINCVENTTIPGFISKIDFKKCFHISHTDTTFNHLEINESENSAYLKNLSTKDCIDFVYEKSQYFGNQIINRHLKDVEYQNSIKSISNYLLTDFLFVFGHVVMLMEDRGIAVFKQGNKVCNILFVSSAIYPSSTSTELFHKGQKIFAIIPNIEEIDTTVIASFVNGLDDSEAENFTNPQEYANCLLPSIFLPFTHKLNENCCSIVNSLIQPDCYVVHLKIHGEILKLHNVMMSLCRSSVCKEQLFNFRKFVIREYIKSDSNDIISFVLKLAKRLKKHCTLKMLQIKCRRKLKSFKNVSYNLPDIAKNVPSPNHFSWTINDEIKKESVLPKNLTLNSKSSDLSKGSCSSLSSYKSFDSIASSETFYSCTSKESSPKKTDPTALSNELDYPEKSNVLLSSFSPEQNSEVSVVLVEGFDKKQNFNSEVSVVLVEDFDKKHNLKLHNMKYMREKREKVKYFYLQSFPFLKHSFFSKRKRLCIQNSKVLNSESSSKDSVKVSASVALITNKFFFFSVNIDGDDIVLPFPRRVIPITLQQKIKLNYCYNIILVPNTLIHLSHILSIDIIPSRCQ